MYFDTIVVLFIYFFIVFIIGQRLEDNSVVDIAWGFGFVIAAVFSYFKGEPFMLRSSIITLMIALWGLRLTYHIGKRNIDHGEDFRYIEMRKRWGTKLPRVKAFINVYLLQWAIMVIVSLPVVYGNGTTDQLLGPTAYFGISLWCFGLYFESVGDAQLRAFKKNPDNKGKLMDKGLWALTRHPNYFGDAAMWFGIFFVAITELSGLWIIIGPILMGFFLRNVSGAKLLEKKYVGRTDYDAYKRRTNMFLPWLPKKV